ncbi:hypothetical protein OHB12_33710 [Nocardia sp. NBC_01730]|uniref:hypothetical protein n=1 Tax=Nocardia sp. NBC_01730 TaxID=2975998 RepID=UPI002E12CB3C|nr:hypothetical protein OHB12_33710 [Nocardia sp. NBC_01730]
MNHNDFRAAIVGVTAGVVAGAVTVAGVIAFDDMDLWGQAERALARRRLSPADRAELERLEDAERSRSRARTRARQEITAEIRAKFVPGFIGGKHPVASLEELSVPQLITGIEHAETKVHENPWLIGGVEQHRAWSDHLAALLDEFHRRRGRDVHRRLSLLDQQLMQSAETRMNTAKFAPPTLPRQAPRPAPTPVEIPADSPYQYPDFIGPDAVEATNTDSVKEI